MPEVLRIDDVALELLSRRHWPLYHALHSSREVMASIGPVLTGDVIAAQFERVLRHNALDTPGHRVWAVSADRWPEPVGLAALIRNGRRAEFGMMLLPCAWRCGLSRAVIGTLLPYAFGAMAVQHVDVSRPNDGHVSVLDRMFDPFYFSRTAGLRPGEVGWTLSRDSWRERMGGPRGAVA